MGQDESCQPTRQELILPSGCLLPVSANPSAIPARDRWKLPLIPPGLLPHQGLGHLMIYKTHFPPQDPAGGVSPSPKATPAQLPAIQTRSGAKAALVEGRTPRGATSAPDLEGNNAITSYHMRMTKGFPALKAARGMGR